MKNSVMVLAKIFAFLNGICVLLIFGGFSGFGKSGGILNSEEIWRYYEFIKIFLLILSITGIILGLIIKINNYEIPKEIKTRGFNSINGMLLMTSPFLLLVTLMLIWFVKFGLH